MTNTEYDKLLKSGMLWEFHPDAFGQWSEDKYLIGGSTRLYVDWLSSPQEKGWAVIRSFQEFKQQFEEGPPDMISFGYELDEKSCDWIQNPENAGTKPPYEEGMETSLKCLVYLYKVCQVNSIPYPEINIHTPHPQGQFDMVKFLRLTCNQMGTTPNFTVRPIDIADDYESGPNYKKFKQIHDKYSEISSPDTINDDIA